MFDNLKEKTEYEFNRFSSGKLCESKRSIFTASREIEIKKMIRERLVRGFDKETDRRLLEIPDLLDAIYQELLLRFNEPYSNETIDRIIIALTGG